MVFTASMEIYGTSVTDKLDRGRGLLQRRYFRQHCTMDYSGYTKDLSSIHGDLSSIFILDNSPAAYRNYTRKRHLFSEWYLYLLVRHFRECDSDQVVVQRPDGYVLAEHIAVPGRIAVHLRCAVHSQSESASSRGELLGIRKA